MISTIFLTLFSDLLISDSRRHFRGLLDALSKPAAVFKLFTYCAKNGRDETHFSYVLVWVVKFFMPPVKGNRNAIIPSHIIDVTFSKAEVCSFLSAEYQNSSKYKLRLLEMRSLRNV